MTLLVNFNASTMRKEGVGIMRGPKAAQSWGAFTSSGVISPLRLFLSGVAEPGIWEQPWFHRHST